MRQFERVILIGCLLLAEIAHAGINITSNRNDNNRSASNLTETILNPGTVGSATFGKLWSYKVDGAIFAQPLYVQGVTVPGQSAPKNVLYVSTMHDVVYAFDADNPGSALWTRDYRSATATPGIPFSTAMGSDGMGVIGTPVIDVPSNSMFFVTVTMELGQYVQRIHKIDIRSGVELATTVIAGTSKGLTFDPHFESERPGLALSQGQVWISFGGTIPGDNQPWHGWIMTYDMNSLAQTGSFVTSTTANGAGVWHSGGAPAVDSGGNVYFLTGNGQSAGYDGVNNFQESLLKFSYSASSGLSLVDWYTAADWQNLDTNDLDLTCNGPMLIPGTDLVAFGGKIALSRVLHTGSLGELTTNDSQVVQKIQTGPTPTIAINDADRIIGLAYWQRGTNNSLMYIWPGLTVLTSYQFNGTSFSQYQQNTLNTPGEPAAALSISANGATAGSGILWVARNVSAGNIIGQDAMLEAYTADNIGTLLWSSVQNPSRDDPGSGGRFTVPVVNNGRVYYATSTGQVVVYGLLNSLPLPTNAVQCAVSGGTCSLPAGITTTVWYGVAGNYASKAAVSGSIACNAGTFGSKATSGSCFYEPPQSIAIAWSSPEPNESVLTGTALTLTATVTDANVGATIVGVSYYDGTTLIGSAIGAPYSVTWTPAAGTHALTAVATDNYQLKATSTISTITAAASNGSPPANAVFCSAEYATCQLPAGTTATVYFGVNGNWNVAPGITGSFACGNALFGDPNYGTGKSCMYVPTTISALSVTLTHPSSLLNLIAGSQVPLTATISDPNTGATVSGVSYYDGSTLLGNVTAAPYAYTWIPAAGSHTVNAVAKDSSAATGSSTAWTVSVSASNGTPPTSAVNCAAENATCTIPSGSTVTVWYGSGNNWNTLSGVTASVVCSNAVFGDPLYGTGKSCKYVQSVLTVTLTRPNLPVNMIAGTQVSLTATVIDSNTAASVTNVTYYDGATVLAAETAAPYAYTWIAAAGSHTLSTVAKDSSAATGSSTAWTVSVSASNGTPPATALTCAAENATCTIPSGTTATVWYGSGNNWNTLPGVTASVVCSNAVFGDPLYGTGKSCKYVPSSLAVTFTHPNSLVSMIAGSQVPLTATVTDPITGATVTSVAYYDGSASLANMTAAPYFYTWTAAAGNHTLSAIATDTSADSGSSSPWTISVSASNGTPPATAVNCAAENANCTIPSGTTATVWYGAGSSWNTLAGVTGSIVCNNAVFGDPLNGTVKSCLRQ